MMDAQVDMSVDMPVKFFFNRPMVADKKFYPKKSIIVLVSTLCGFILSIFVLLMLEKIENKPSDETEEPKA